MLTRELQQTLSKAMHEAMHRRHEYVTLEHILYALLQEPTGSDVIRNCSGNVAELRSELEQFMAASIETLSGKSESTPESTAAFERVLEGALLQAQASGQATIDGGNMLEWVPHKPARAFAPIGEANQ